MGVSAFALQCTYGILALLDSVRSELLADEPVETEV